MSDLQEDAFPQKLDVILTWLTSDFPSLLPLPEKTALSPIILHILQNGFELPKDQQSILDKKLDSIVPHVDHLGHQMDDSLVLSGIIGRMQEDFDKVHAKINGWWEDIQQSASTNVNDLSKFEDQLFSISSKHDDGMASILNQLHHDLSDVNIPSVSTEDDDPQTGPPLEVLRTLLEKRVTSIVDQYFAYDLIAMRRNIEHWIICVAGIQAKGAALLMMAEKYRLVLAKKASIPSAAYAELQLAVVSNILRHDRTYEERLGRYKELLSGGSLLNYPASHLLVEQHAIDVEKQCPPLYSLHVCNDKLQPTWRLLRIDRFDTEGEMIEGPFVRHLGQPNFSQAFAFARSPSHDTWNMRGSRFEAHPEGAASWTVGYQGDKIGLFPSSSPAQVKIIPLKSANHSDPVVLLLVLNSERTSVLRRWRVWIQVSAKLPSPLLFTTSPAPEQRALSILPGAKRILFWVNNLTTNNTVFVLQDIRGHSAYDIHLATNGAVWLNQQRGCIAFGVPDEAEDCADLEIVMIWHAYQLRQDINGEDRRAIEHLVYQNPQTGCGEPRCREVLFPSFHLNGQLVIGHG